MEKSLFKRRFCRRRRRRRGFLNSLMSVLAAGLTVMLHETIRYDDF